MQKTVTQQPSYDRVSILADLREKFTRHRLTECKRIPDGLRREVLTAVGNGISPACVGPWA